MENAIYKQNKNVKELLKLIKENPNLKIVPMVESEIVADCDYARWLGSFGKSKIDFMWVDDDRVYFKSIDDEDLVERELDYIDENVDDESAEKMAIATVESIKWEKVIVVEIDLP